MIEKTADLDPISGARPIDAAQTRLTLEGMLNTCNAAVMAFDLDSTLLDNRPRNARIMREFGQTIDHSLLVNAQAQHWQSWSATQAMQNIGLSRSDAMALNATYEAFWAERFFTSEYCRDDCAIAGAAQYVQSVARYGAHALFISLAT